MFLTHTDRHTDTRSIAMAFVVLFTICYVIFARSDQPSRHKNDLMTEENTQPFKTHTENKCTLFFLQVTHIENDENVIFWFIYLIFIYFYKIKKIYETKG